MTDVSPAAAGPIISVRGEAFIEAPPEIARLVVHVQSKDDDRRKALDRLTENNRRCLDLIEGYGDAVEQIETGGLTISPVLRYRRREGDVHYYQGTVRINLVIVDFELLGELVTRIGDLERTSVSGPFWRLRRDSPVHREAARQAARQAVDRARSYADALGCRLTGMIELADEGLSGGDQGDRFAVAPMGAMARGGAAAAEPEPIALVPETQTVTATVEARFTASAPMLDLPDE